MDSQRFAALWGSLADIGRTDNGYLRYAFSAADFACREWFTEEAIDRDLMVETDRNGNLWAWWGSPAGGHAVVTGSHFDSVPHGGGYDGPLGIVSAFLAVDLLRERGQTPDRPLGIVAFAEEEGSRFGLACLGSRLMTGAVPADRALSLRDRDGVSLRDALIAAELDPLSVGSDPQRLSRIGTFVELHIEQGRTLVGAGRGGLGDLAARPVATRHHRRGQPCRHHRDGRSSRSGAHPRYAVVLAAHEEARTAGARATIGRVTVEPNATNAIAARVSAWIDVRAPEQSTLDKLVEVIGAAAAGDEQTTAALIAESLSPVTEFDSRLRDRLVGVLGGAPVLPTGAGHDAAILSAHVSTAMLFVRNPTGVSHAPAEYATDEDCTAGVVALADVLAELACH